MRHILLTRYNITFGPAVKAGIDSLDKDWLDYRDRLFRTYSVPSVAAQRNRDFEWFVLFHPATPPRYYESLDGVATVVLAEDLRSAKKKISRRRLLRGATLTTRMDNDDCIAVDFTAQTRAAAEEAVSNRFGHWTDFVVVPRSGAMVDLALHKWQPRQPVSPGFVSLYQGPRLWRKWQTPLDFDHRTIIQLYPFVVIEGAGPLWLRTLHAKNLSSPPEQPADRDIRELVDRFPALEATILQSGEA